AQLRAEISIYRQGNSTVTEYYNRLKNLWSEYISFRPISPCECGGGTHTGVCNTYAAVKNHQENDHVIDFIIGLNNEHDNTKSQLLLMDPPPSLKTASKFAMKLERQLKGISKEVKGVESIALAGGNSREWSKNREIKPNAISGDTSGTTELFCRYCKQTNHNIEDCYRMKNKRRNERNGAGPGGFQSYANNTHYGEQQREDYQQEHDRTSGSNNGPLQLSPEDYSRLMLLLQKTSNTASSSSSSQPTNSSTRTPNPNNQSHSNFAGPSYTEDDWLCKRS
ncbi:hypothetical protein LINPERPRIM_LOCUS33090, partial [Linum perenne]